MSSASNQSNIGQENRHACVVGMGWGDEGKGKIVDLLAGGFDVVVRFNGGANAGHTVRIGDDSFALHLLPSGVLRDKAISVIGPGVVVDPIALIEEIEGLEARGIDLAGRLLVSDRAHLVMPYHKLEDRLRDSGTQGKKIGTTAKGIGPCYAEKMLRSSAFRMIDLVHLDRHTDRLKAVCERKAAVLEAMGADDAGINTIAINYDEINSTLEIAERKLSKYVAETTSCLEDAVAKGQQVLFESANGMLLDIDHGTFPYVTASHTGLNGVPAGAGVSPHLVRRCVGVTKAYATRVGNGPFPSELLDERGDRIREVGREFGTTTGRPRRCGWLDAVTLRQTKLLGGVTEIAMMHMDTLSGMAEVGICTGYSLRGEAIRSMPADSEDFAAVDPHIEMLPGWKDDVSGVTKFESLPAEARNYVTQVEELVGAPITMVSVGPERNQTIHRT
ncbi:MAG: adenylosuccinate synthetase [Phycisphaerae bacterium]|nr:MAG: adenylosuccinate synthetase [Phycisphaerae bacterium]